MSATALIAIGMVAMTIAAMGAVVMLHDWAVERCAHPSGMAIAAGVLLMIAGMAAVTAGFMLPP